MSRLLSAVFGVLALLVPLADSQDRTYSLPGVRRAEMVAIAQRFADHKWTCQARNLVAPCVRAKYKSDFTEGQVVKGIAYDWGGADSPEAFDRKLAQGQAAGSHSRHGITGCTAGIDCSGFVSLCWKQKANHEFSTRTIRTIAGRSRLNLYTDLRPGDAMNKPGSHIVLFMRYNQDGTPFVCEAAGSPGRVVCRSWRWSQLQGYQPLTYKMTIEED